MHLTLNDFLKLNTNNIPQLVLVSASIENSPIVMFALDYLKNKLNPPLNTQKFNADRHFNFELISQIISSKSLFDEVNYIEIHYKTKPTVEHIEILNEIYPKLSPENILVIATDKLNKRDFNTKWIKAIEDHNGIILNVDTECYPTIAQHIFKTAGITILPNVLNFLIEMNQGNSSQFMQEIHKLSLEFGSGTSITIDNIKNSSANNSQYNIYQLSNAYLSGDLVSSLKILENVFLAPEDAILINWIITEDTRKLLKTKARLKNNNNNLNQIIRDVGVWGDAIKHFPRAVSRLSYQQLLNIFELASELDFITKGISTNNIQQHLIKIITTLCDNGATTK